MFRTGENESDEASVCSPWDWDTEVPSEPSPDEPQDVDIDKYAEASRWIRERAVSMTLSEVADLARDEIGDYLPEHRGEGTEKIEDEEARAEYAFWNIVLGDLYSSGEVAGKSWRDAMGCYRCVDPISSPRVANMYMEGQGVPQDTAYADRIFVDIIKHEKDSEVLDCGKFRLQCFKMLEERHGAGKSEEQSVAAPADMPDDIKWTLRAAENGDGYCCYLMGEYYREGKGVPRDKHQAKIWYAKAMENGETEAFGALNDLREEDDASAWEDDVPDPLPDWFVTLDKTLPKESEQTRELRRRAESGDAAAECDLANFYSTGNEEIVKNTDSAIVWWQYAAEHGSFKACIQLAQEYGSEGKEEQASRYFGAAAKVLRNAAAGGDSQKMFDLGQVYALAGNHEEAAIWFRRAADCNHSAAQLWLAKYYEEGLSLAANPDKALRWYRASAEQGNVEAQRNLARCLLQQGREETRREACTWLLRAMSAGSLEAFYDGLKAPAEGDVPWLPYLCRAFRQD